MPSIAKRSLSHSAARQLDTLRSLRQQGGDEAWRKGVDMLRQDAGLTSEIRAVNNALNARYGFGAFTDKADELAARTIEDRTPAEGRKALAEEVPRLSEVRAVSTALQLAEKPAPMFAAVTSFSESVEQVAARRAWAHPQVTQTLDELATKARTVWVDPARAAGAIRARIEGGAHKTLRDEILKSPEAFGELRGSGRMLDRFSAAGAERKAKEANRSRMAIEVPGLSPASVKAIEQVHATKDHAARQAVVAGLSHEVRAEIARLDKALRARFGNYGSASEQELARRVPAQQQEHLAALRPRMVATNATITAGHNLQFEQERLQRGQTRSITPSM